MEAAGAGTMSRYYRERFNGAGLPLFDEDFSASTDVFNRAVPLLGLVFVGELLGAVQLEWSLLANLAAIAGGLAILIGGHRRRQPRCAAARSSRARATSAGSSSPPSSSSRRCCR